MYMNNINYKKKYRINDSFQTLSIILRINSFNAILSFT